MSAPYTIYGALGSPYSMKVRAALRAKGVPFVWKTLTADIRADVFAHVKAPVIPIIHQPDGSWTNDSTPFLLGLEADGIGRALLPEDPALRFANLLIEDMADEWIMKSMFHFRWAYSDDAKRMSEYLIYDNLPGAGLAAIAPVAADIAQRQISRMALVGCTPETKPAIEAMFARVIGIVNEAALAGPFFFGTRPSLADIALMAHLGQQAIDPTPCAIMRRDAPFAWRWLQHVDDTSGTEGDWDTAALERPAVKALLGMVGDSYLPFLAANLKAIEAGEATFSMEMEGHPYAQGTFGYQAKCLKQLQAGWATLPDEARARLGELIGPNSSHLTAN